MDSSDEAGKETVKDQMERILPANLDTQVLEIVDTSATRASAPPSAVPQVQTGTQMGSSDEAGKESVKDQMERILRANLDIQVLVSLVHKPSLTEPLTLFHRKLLTLPVTADRVMLWRL